MVTRYQRVLPQHPPKKPLNCRGKKEEKTLEFLCRFGTEETHKDWGKIKERGVLFLLYSSLQWEALIFILMSNFRIGEALNINWIYGSTFRDVEGTRGNRDNRKWEIVPPASILAGLTKSRRTTGADLNDWTTSSCKFLPAIRRRQHNIYSYTKKKNSRLISDESTWLKKKISTADEYMTYQNIKQTRAD